VIGYRIDCYEIIRLQLLSKIASYGALDRIAVGRLNTGIVNRDADESVSAELPTWPVRVLHRRLSVGFRPSGLFLIGSRFLVDPRRNCRAWSKRVDFLRRAVFKHCKIFCRQVVNRAASFVGDCDVERDQVDA